MFSKVRLSLVLFFLYLLLASPASASTMSLTPAKTTVGQGGTFTMQLRLDTQGEAVNAVDVGLSYPKDLVEVSYVTQGANFQTAAQKSFGGGAINLSFATLNPSNGQLTLAQGNVTVATIGFKAKALGTANIAISGGAQALKNSDSSNSLSATSGSSVTISQAPPSTAKPAANASGPQILGVKVDQVTSSGAVVSWSTDKKTDSVLEFGFEKDHYFATTSKAESVTDHSLQINNLALIPGSLVHYHIIAKDSTGAVTTSDDATLQLKGYVVRLKLTNTNKLPVKDLKVTFYSNPMTGVTNDQGEVTFTNVTPERHLAVIKGANFERTAEVIVASTDSLATPQDFPITVDVAGLSNLGDLQTQNMIRLYMIAIFILTLLLIALGVFIYKKKGGGFPFSKKTQNNQIPSIFAPPTNEPVVYQNDPLKPA